jgi:hypothetical protein
MAQTGRLLFSHLQDSSCTMKRVRKYGFPRLLMPSKFLLTSSGVFPRNQPYPSSELTALGERRSIANRRNQRGGS